MLWTRTQVDCSSCAEPGEQLWFPNLAYHATLNLDAENVYMSTFDEYRPAPKVATSVDETVEAAIDFDLRNLPVC